MTEKGAGLTYKSAGVDYDAMDPLKREAQRIALTTARNLEKFGFAEVPASRGESAYVFDMGPFYGAFTPEGLGTKNLAADIYACLSQERSFYDFMARDAVAMIVNDLITVGAAPVVISPHWAAGSSEWFKNEKRYKDLINGWAQACNEAGATWGAGETSTLLGVINPETIELSGAGFGIISPKERLTLGEKLGVGNHIILIESSGIHANGLSSARKIASENLLEGYQTRLGSGRMFGEAILTPTHIYARLQRSIFETGVDIHYMVNITGHGWRKLMRANKDFTYRIHTIPQPQEEFLLMQEAGPISEREAYATFNMGAGFAFFVSETDVARVCEQASFHEFRSWDAGIVEEGPRQVIIEPKGIVFGGESLELR